MENAVRNAVYIQSGGPTAVINCSAAGVIEACRRNRGKIGKLYASLHGIEGLLQDELYDCDMIPEETIAALKKTPSMAFGSCRYTVREDDPEDYEKILHTLRKHDIGYIFINGGNGSAAAGMRLSGFLKKKGYDFSLIMIPKTVDNDIACIDHAPGFPSAAKHVVTAVSELVHDMHTYDTDLIMAVEVMGRNTGYLAAASMAAAETGWGPDLIYVPEKVFEPAVFVEDVRRVLQRKGKCFAVVSEGVKTPDGKYLFEDTTVNKAEDPSRNMGGITPYLNKLLRAHFSCKIRCIDLGLMQRCGAHDASDPDRREAEELGSYAVQQALQGKSERIVTHSAGKLTDLALSEAAGRERVMELSYLTEEGNYIREEYLEYILPLIGELPVYAKL